MTRIPEYVPRNTFLQKIKADLAMAKQPEETESKNQPTDFKDVLGTKEYTESIKNLSLILRNDKPSTRVRLEGPIVLSKREIEPEEDMTYCFLDEKPEANQDDYDEAGEYEAVEYDEEDTYKEISYRTHAERMELGEFLDRIKDCDFDIIPVLQNLNYSTNNAFMPEDIKGIIVPNPEHGDQIIIYTKDGNKRALIDFSTGLRDVQEKDKYGKWQDTLLDDCGCLIGEYTIFGYPDKK